MRRFLVEHPVTPGRSTIAGRAILSRQVEQIPDILDDPEYAVPIADVRCDTARSLLERAAGRQGSDRGRSGARPQASREPFQNAKWRSCRPSPTRR